MLAYPASLKKSSSRYLASFRDIPEALTECETLDSAIEMASDALATAIEFYFEDRREVPRPSKAKRGEILVALPASTSAKILLLNAMVEKGITLASLARSMGISPQAVTRIVDIRHSTKIDTIESALGVLGKKLILEVSDA